MTTTFSTKLHQVHRTTMKSSKKSSTSERHHHKNSETATQTTEETESLVESSEELPGQGFKITAVSKQSKTARGNDVFKKLAFFGKWCLG